MRATLNNKFSSEMEVKKKKSAEKFNEKKNIIHEPQTTSNQKYLRFFYVYDFCYIFC